MRNCVGCRYALWDKTNAGRLHQSGKGICTYEVKIPTLPQCMHWIADYTTVTIFVHTEYIQHINNTPKCTTTLKGGAINRHTDFPQHCPCYQHAND